MKNWMLIAIEIAMPGGSLIALALLAWKHRSRERRTAARTLFSPSLSLVSRAR